VRSGPNPSPSRPLAVTEDALEEILVGPAHENDGRLNLFGALRTSLATCGYENIKEFQRPR
jgi:IMP dehydrogenase